MKNNNTSPVMEQVNTAINNAFRNLAPETQQLPPKDESDLRDMAFDIQDKIRELSSAQATLLNFLNQHGSNNKPIYS